MVHTANRENIVKIAMAANSPVLICFFDNSKESDSLLGLLKERSKSEGRIPFLKVDASKNEKLGKLFEIEGLPTLVICKRNVILLQRVALKEQKSTLNWFIEVARTHLQ